MTGMRLKLLLQLVVRTLLNTFEHFHAATLSLQPKIAFSGSCCCCCCCYFIDSNAKLQLQLQHTHTHRKKKSSNTACSERAQFSSSSLESFVLAGSWKVKVGREKEWRGEEIWGNTGRQTADAAAVLYFKFFILFCFLDTRPLSLYLRVSLLSLCAFCVANEFQFYGHATSINFIFMQISLPCCNFPSPSLLLLLL